MKEPFLFVESIKIPRTITPYLGVIFITPYSGLRKTQARVGAKQDNVVNYVKTEKGE